MRDAGYKRYVDDRNTWITTSDKFEHARNYHCSAWERKSRDYDIGHRESLSYRPPDDESADSEMNSRSNEAVKAHSDCYETWAQCERSDVPRSGTSLFCL